MSGLIERIILEIVRVLTYSGNNGKTTNHEDTYESDPLLQGQIHAPEKFCWKNVEHQVFGNVQASIGKEKTRLIEASAFDITIPCPCDWVALKDASDSAGQPRKDHHD